MCLGVGSLGSCVVPLLCLFCGQGVVSHSVTRLPSSAARRWVWVPEGAGGGGGAGDEGGALGACDQLHLSPRTS